ncbi:hypothetical protein DPMN_190354 [Dreissena polymorpha]|uniref:Uncharacterized protein n=1 Tax=Dreissena polymorpha TaxID=45954 RepID=A0A9D4DVS3_DREPO|nr:hypothetical protein DPMN_190354 [Dreissena polymorpha]
MRRPDWLVGVDANTLKETSIAKLKPDGAEIKNEMKLVLYVLNKAVIAFVAEPAYPVCSRYNKEEKLWERVFRKELTMEQPLKDIKGTNTKFVDALRNFQKENEKVNNAFLSMERRQI